MGFLNLAQALKLWLLQIIEAIKGRKGSINESNEEGEETSKVEFNIQQVTVQERGATLVVKERGTTVRATARRNRRTVPRGPPAGTN